MNRRILAVAVSAVAALAVLVVGLAGAHDAGADNGGEGLALLHRAGSQAAKLGFDGTVVVRWRDGARWHRQSVPVHMDDGVLRMGDDRLVSAGARRLLRTDAGWQLMWAGGPKGSEPDPARKYRFVVSGRTTVADRPAVEVDVTRAGASHVAERFAFDRETGVLLRRDQLDEQGRLTRSFAFRAADPAGPGAPGEARRRADAERADAWRDPAPTRRRARRPHRAEEGRPRIPAGRRVLPARRIGAAVLQRRTVRALGVRAGRRPRLGLAARGWPDRAAR